MGLSRPVMGLLKLCLLCVYIYIYIYIYTYIHTYIHTQNTAKILSYNATEIVVNLLFISFFLAIFREVFSITLICGKLT